jgi:hypothetical protein
LGILVCLKVTVAYLCRGGAWKLGAALEGGRHRPCRRVTSTGVAPALCGCSGHAEVSDGCGGWRVQLLFFGFWSQGSSLATGFEGRGKPLVVFSITMEKTLGSRQAAVTLQRCFPLWRRCLGSLGACVGCVRGFDTSLQQRSSD